MFLFLYIYTYITDTFYLLVVNCCCCRCVRAAGCRACRLPVQPSLTCPRAWDDGGRERPRSQNNFFFVFSRIPCSMLGKGKGRLLNRLMHCSLLNPSPLLPVHVPPVLWVRHTFSEDRRGRYLLVSRLLLWCLWQRGGAHPGAQEPGGGVGFGRKEWGGEGGGASWSASEQKR